MRTSAHDAAPEEGAGKAAHGAGEAALCERLVRGDRAAAGEFYDAYAPRVRRYIAVSLGSFGTRQDAEDLTQETFISMAEALPFFRGESSLFTFACAIAHRKVQSFIRVGARRARIAATIDPPGHPGESSARDEVLSRALGALDPDYRELLHLKYAEDASVAEIAAIRAESEHAVESRLARARRALKRLMEDQR
ncbi:MAG: RNA polymerase sigma factor [Candidatus Binataceae bacterium]